MQESNLIHGKLIRIEGVTDNLLSNLESRNIALWVHSLPKNFLNQDALIAFIGLPWRLVFSEVYDPGVIQALETAESLNAAITRKRGFIQIIDSDPSRIELPQRCLPFYLLNGRSLTASATDFESRLRRMTMLDELRRSGVREILIVSSEGDPVPPGLSDLWSSGFRSYLTFVSDATDAEQAVKDWIQKAEDVQAVNYLCLPVDQVVVGILAKYSATYPENRRVIRVRDVHGRYYKVDVTEADEPERPVLEWYSIVEERDLTSMLPEELSEEDFIAFFQNPESSWRPYAAGLPWIRDTQCRKAVGSCLKKLDTIGPEENCIAYISSESGAGGTTLARMLAWEYAREGYPTLFAKSVPFMPDALSVGNFLNRVHNVVEGQLAHIHELAAENNSALLHNKKNEPTSRLYETPWVIVFDSLHWHYRDNELVHFRNELEKSGRPVCVLVVTGTTLGLPFYNTSVFKRVAELNHALGRDEARQLGRHLNQFMRVYGKQRQDWQWDRFYEDHTVRFLDGISAFWVTLSFWIQGQYDLSESIQQWMYLSFKNNAGDQIIRQAILEIAALSSERLPLPEALLPVSKGKWPVSYLLEDTRSSLAALGLVRVSTNGQKHWALVHDILGRFLINALFYDFHLREELGFAEAKDAEHLRFLLLRQISRKPMLGERAYRSIGEDFATSIFKIDPDHGRGSLAPLWREVLEALDGMPRALRDTSRVFRHHTAVSRRRIAKLDENYYGVMSKDRVDLLNKAIDDINYALSFIEYSGSEPDLNLFNSLANAYLDLAEVESARGTARERIIELRRLASDATRRAYEESPTSSFVIETYVKNLLEGISESSEQAVHRCIEALGVLFSALTSNEAAYRKSKLGSLADEALAVLFQQTPSNFQEVEPASTIDVLVKAWKLLTEGNEYQVGMELSEVPEMNRLRALEALSHPAGIGNMQVLRLSYDLTSVCHPYNYIKQLEFVEQLQATDYRMAPQLRLEYAILLFQNNRANEGDKLFRVLRPIWRDSEQFVQVPERLRWLRSDDGETLKVVHAIIGSDYGNRPMARVQEFNNTLVPFRPEEHGFRETKPGSRFACCVSFGHNGPFLRPVTAHAPIDR